MTPIHGIPCTLPEPKMRKAVRRVLGQIQERFPKDFERLQKRVRDIGPYTDNPDGDHGCWIGEDLEELWVNGEDEELISGVVLIPDDLPIRLYVASLAHEFGHAATRWKDLERRGPTSEEWRSELAADWYAYKWGFGRDIAEIRKGRGFLHHGPTPGHTWTEPRGDGYFYHYKVTRNFVVHFLGRTKDETQAPSTAS